MDVRTRTAHVCLFVLDSCHMCEGAIYYSELLRLRVCVHLSKPLRLLQIIRLTVFVHFFLFFLSFDPSFLQVYLSEPSQLVVLCCLALFDASQVLDYINMYI